MGFDDESSVGTVVGTVVGSVVLIAVVVMLIYRRAQARRRVREVVTELREANRLERFRQEQQQPRQVVRIVEWIEIPEASGGPLPAPPAYEQVLNQQATTHVTADAPGLETAHDEKHT
ncbi:hypothetical protein L596_026563 [Steinernema carpocapsae]|uniref:Uncharacterized protein n=1 Tax=Steinernema carpocapsae TaxID=34508 RepID=A0A4U5M1Q9_STECR|nr:hypothetical protein L596_026563 [Steinernema carpocapsae]